MKRVSLNHALHASKINWLSTVLLIVGICLLAAELFYLQQLTAKSELLEAEIETLSTSESAGAKLSAQSRFNQQLSATQEASKNAELQAVNKAIHDIMLPWPSLFKALENANHDDVKILTIAPNLKNNSVQIIAVTFDFKSMSAYIHNLNQQAKFKAVNLVSNEAVDVNGQAATQFELRLILNE